MDAMNCKQTTILESLNVGEISCNFSAAVKLNSLVL